MAMATGTLYIWSPAQKPPSPQKSYRLLSNEKKSGRKAYSLSLPPWPSCLSCHGMYGIHALSSLSSHHSILPEISFLSSTTHRTLVAFLKCIFLRSYLYDLCLAFFLLLFFLFPDKFACVRRATGGSGIVCPRNRRARRPYAIQSQGPQPHRMY